MKANLKKGDYVICKKNCISQDNSINFDFTFDFTITLNKKYEILYQDFDGYYSFAIFDDNDVLHEYDMNESSPSYYGIWFYTTIEYRKMKLQKLLKI